MAEQGLEIVNFTGGTLDDTPTLVKNATKQAIDEGFGSGLTDSSGLHELREAISESLSSDRRYMCQSKTGNHHYSGG